MIYQPAEDSFLMSENLRKEIPKLLNENSDLRFLEIGCGSGINLETIRDLNVKNIFSSDINPEAVEHCRKLGFDCIESNLFEKVNGKFDLIIFNPPYLPEDSKEPEDSRLETTGGKKGNEIIIEFLKQSKDYLDKKGKIFLITSSLSEDMDFKKFGYDSRIIDRKNLFFEELNLWELTC